MCNVAGEKSAYAWLIACRGCDATMDGEIKIREALGNFPIRADRSRNHRIERYIVLKARERCCSPVGGELFSNSLALGSDWTGA